MLHYTLLVVHLLAAAIWVGGHLILCFRYLPLALKEKNPQHITAFEKQYEPIGIPALLLLVITGVWMSFNFGVGVSLWFSFSNPVEKIVSIKLLLLFITFVLAVHARFFIIPKLSPEKLGWMAVHIIAVTVTGVLMLIVGASMRIGGIF